MHANLAVLFLYAIKIHRIKFLSHVQKNNPVYNFFGQDLSHHTRNIYMGTENDPMFEYPHKIQNIVYLFKSLQCHLRKEYETKLNIRGLN